MVQDQSRDSPTGKPRMPRGQAADSPTGIPEEPVGGFRRPPPTSRRPPPLDEAVEEASGLRELAHAHLRLVVPLQGMVAAKRRDRLPT